MRNDKGIEKISEIISRRLDGEAITKIANDLGVSRQYIHSIISCFPKGDFQFSNGLEFNLERKELFHKIALEYFFLLPSRLVIKRDGLDKYSDEAIHLVSLKNNIDEAQIRDIFYRISNHHPPIHDTPYYRNIVDWQKYNGIGLLNLSNMTNIPSGALHSIFKGWTHMPLRTARKIQRCSGLTIAEIYSDLLKIDEEENSEKDQ